MHKQFDDVYQQLYENFSVPRRPYLPFFNPIFDDLSPRQIRDMIHNTQRAIDEVVASQAVPIRSDAKYFLLVNFVEMILFPISIVRERGFYEEGGNIITEAQMREVLATDVQQIINEAISKKDAEIAELPWSERDNPEHRKITGHNVLDAIGSAWNKIKFNEYLYWTG